MFKFKIIEKYWIDKTSNDPEDLCAHGRVEVVFNNETIVEEVTISAAGLYLLRSLSDGHIDQFENLFPCCGFSMYPNEDKTKVIISGCSNGLNYDIRHLDNMIIITNKSKESVSITYADYKNNILSFVNEVENFYLQSNSKIVSSEDIDGYDSFWNEWHSLKKMHY